MLQSHNARGTGPMSVVRLDEEDLDEEDLAILREVASKGGGNRGCIPRMVEILHILGSDLFVMWV